MRFNPKARLDNTRISDRGAGGGGMGGGLGGALGGGSGGGGLPMPGGKGGIGSIIVLIIMVIAGFSTGGFGLAGGGGGEGPATDRYANCRSGEDANTNADCARSAVLESLDGYWAATMADQTKDGRFVAPKAVTFSGATSTGCGQGSSAMGPFYCPSDQTIYEDTAFYEEVFQRQLGGSAEDFVEPYVLAHEYGHHVSNLRNLLGAGGYSQTGPGSKAIRTELLADCYAGLWAGDATQTKDADGNTLITDIDESDMQEALDAARTVGDDYIQKKSGARVDDESWTHGSSAQRQKWFKTGYESGEVAQCDRVLTLDAGKI